MVKKIEVSKDCCAPTKENICQHNVYIEYVDGTIVSKFFVNSREVITYKNKLSPGAIDHIKKMDEIYVSDKNKKKYNTFVEAIKKIFRF